MVTSSASFLKTDGIRDCYNQRQPRADQEPQAFVSNSGLFDGKHQRIHLTFWMKKEKPYFHFFELVIVSRRRTFSRRRLDLCETLCPCGKGC